MKVRHSTYEDLPAMMAIYERARCFMVEHDNPNQWAKSGYPEEELLRGDIAEGCSYVCEEEGRVIGTFLYRFGKDIEPTYACIEDGAWLSEEPYGVVHRIAVDGTVKGTGAFCIEWCYEECGHIRIDTHEDNYVMQNLLGKLGFTKCGTIYLLDGDPRWAYEKCE